jgi:hypothetical protein
VRPGTVVCGTEDGELATADLQHVALFIVNVRIVGRSGQHLRIVRTGGLHNGHETPRRLEDLDPAVVAYDSVSADEDCSSGANRDAGVLQAESDDLVELLVAKALPCLTQCGVDSEKRFTIGP